MGQVAKLDIYPTSMLVVEDEPLKIPGCAPSFLRGCDSINIQYDLVVTVDNQVAIRCPIVIGKSLSKDKGRLEGESKGTVEG